jgi:PAP2 superfamily
MISRRTLLATAALAALVERTGAAASTTPAALRRNRFVTELRRKAAEAALGRGGMSAATNGDEARYSDFRAAFSKTMPQNDFGEVEPAAYRRWLQILASNDSAAFESIPRDSQAVERLNNPQAAYAIELHGPGAADLDLAPPPAFASARQAAEMAELYWRALMRDLPFHAWGTDPLARAAVADLTTFGFTENDPTNLFRGPTGFERNGPLISQFLWLDVPYGGQTIVQRVRAPVRGQAFLTRFADWLACQRGAKPVARINFDATPRYISSFCELAEYVHTDFSFQPFLNAALIAMRMGGERGELVLSPTNPYRGSRTQFGDITFGNKNLLSLLAQAALLAQEASYFYKWQVHRRARPEVIGARIDVALSGRKSYDLHRTILDCDGLSRIRAAYGSGLLPQAYPEGCPTHPSYPAAHAVNAGACATVLKAFFDETAVVPKPVQAAADGSSLQAWDGVGLTIAGEIDKLAANIALGRDSAGVHFRSDSLEGLKLGEAVGIGLLAEISCTYNERFDGFVLVRLDGNRVRIANGVVRVMS